MNHIKVIKHSSSTAAQHVLYDFFFGQTIAPSDPDVFEEEIQIGVAKLTKNPLENTMTKAFFDTLFLLLSHCCLLLINPYLPQKESLLREQVSGGHDGSSAKCFRCATTSCRLRLFTLWTMDSSTELAPLDLRYLITDPFFPVWEVGHLLFKWMCQLKCSYLHASAHIWRQFFNLITCRCRWVVWGMLNIHIFFSFSKKPTRPKMSWKRTLNTKNLVCSCLSLFLSNLHKPTFPSWLIMPS